MSIKAYQRAATQAEAPRDLEYRAFGKATADLVRAKEAGLKFAALAEALETNRKLWNVLAADCVLPENQLPLQLRAQIVSLALWVSRYSSEVLRDGAELDPLIEINKTMMEGLGGK